VRFEVPDPAAAGTFWGRLLGRGVVAEPGGVLVPGSPTQVGLRFARLRPEPVGPDRLHLHVTSETVEDQRRTAESVLALGGRRRGSGPLPFGRDLYLRDPGGNDFCVIEPGNGYLAGCGPLGEVTCDGTPAVGRFWQAALGWAVVWDLDDQVAVQSPAGGTKIAWDGAALPDRDRRSRHRFDLVAADPAAEAERLIGLGATRLGGGDGELLLADPDGNEFALASDQQP
jgi:predicted enzyme related to lactoylglutathione lyase